MIEMGPRWREMYERVLRMHGDAFDSAIGEDAAGDRAYAFFIFCFHLKDWIKNDTSIDAGVRAAVEAFVSATPALALAADIANGVKHLVRDRSVRVDDSVRLSAGGDRLGMNFSLGTSVLGFVLVIAGDHGHRPARSVADECVKAWTTFLTTHRLLTL